MVVANEIEDVGVKTLLLLEVIVATAAIEIDRNPSSHAGVAVGV